ncbi:hypothetical protein H845_1022 [Komagataeibacter xylinus E25]|nr:hypothetical protein H845_1022 [Komagataeibacter xylinus E25]
MGQISMKISALPGSVLSENQQAIAIRYGSTVIAKADTIACIPTKNCDGFGNILFARKGPTVSKRAQQCSQFVCHHATCRLRGCGRSSQV